MAADKIIKDLLKAIDTSIDDFQKGLPAIQDGVLDGVIEQIKDLQTQNGRILNSVQNLKVINQIKAKLERLLITQGYKDSVKKFIQAFDLIESIHLEYFAVFNRKFKPVKSLPIIKKISIDTTINGLIGQGLQVNIVDQIGKILFDSATTGVSYASLNEQLRKKFKGDAETEGILQRYGKTISTDALNQYSAQYHEAIAADLGLSWMRYIGSNITTTREFCELLTAKEWIHKSELPEILKGHIDGHSCKLSKSTGLPLGMIPGTDKDNFKVRRGGYSCGHQVLYVPDSVVPENIKQGVKV
jgi:hypothetical protein